MAPSRRAPRRPRAPRRRRPVAGKRLVKTIRRVAQATVNKNLETKYVVKSQSGELNYVPIENQLTSKVAINAIGYLQPAIPPLLAGLQSNQMVGSFINNAKGRVDFHFGLQSTDSATRDIIVKLFCLESRAAKNIYQMTNLTAKDLLRMGTDDATDWEPGINTLQLTSMPVNTLAWKVHHVKSFRLSKNAGFMNNDATAGAPPPTNSAVNNYKTFSWSWNHKGKLRYDELQPGGAGVSGISDYPMNYAPVFGVVAYYPDGTTVGDPGSPLPVNITVRTHMWYKDA